MSIEPIPELNLDQLPTNSAWLEEISALEKRNSPLVTLVSSPDRWDTIQEFLLALRSSNVSAVLLLQRGDFMMEDEEAIIIFTFLRDWDQLLLHNFLEICEGWVPQEYQAKLRTEAKIELKWFQEWLMAASDIRIHKYPGLPWRSFVRKIVGENFAFATEFIRLNSLPSTPENRVALDRLIRNFLEAKKKVVCVFPKRWGKD